MSKPEPTGEIVQCWNCGWKGDSSLCDEVDDPLQRFELGDTYTDCQCPECGSLAVPPEPENDAPVKELEEVLSYAASELEDLESGIRDGTYDDDGLLEKVGSALTKVNAWLGPKQ